MIGFLRGLMPRSYIRKENHDQTIEYVVHPKATLRFRFLTAPTLLFIFVMIPAVILYYSIPVLMHFKSTPKDLAILSIFIFLPILTLMLYFAASTLLSRSYRQMGIKTDMHENRICIGHDKNIVLINPLEEKEIIPISQVKEVSVRSRNSPYHYSSPLHQGNWQQRRKYSEARSDYDDYPLSADIIDALIFPNLYDVDFNTEGQIFMIAENMEKKCALRLIRDFIKDTGIQASKSDNETQSLVTYISYGPNQ